MALADERKRLGREPIQIVELVADKCALTFGVSPCTATGEPCYNTRQTCKDPANFDRGSTSLFFAEPHSGLPVGMFPAISGVSNSPTKIDPKKGLGLRASVSVTLKEFPHHDIGIDPYVDQRAYDTRQGTFWGKWKARNDKSYLNRPLKLHVGYIEEGKPFDWANFQTLEYVVSKIDGPGKRGMVTITGKDPLHKLDDVLLPAPAKNKLVADMGVTDTSMTVTDGGDTLENLVRIGAEIIGFDAVTDNGDGTKTLTGLVRGVKSSVEDHGAGDAVQPCIDYRATHIIDAMRDLMARAGIDDAQIDIAGFDFQKAIWLGSFFTDNILSKPVKAFKNLADASSQSLAYIWWNDRTAQVKIATLSPRLGNEQLDVYNDNAHLLADTTDLKHDVNSIINVMHVAFERIDYTESGKVTNYRSIESVAHGASDNAEFTGTTKPEIIYADWIAQPGEAFALASRTVAEYAFGKQLINFAMDAKDAAVWLGDIVSIQTKNLQDVTGGGRTVDVQITRANEDGTTVKYEALIASFEGRYIFFAPDAVPDYDSATDEEKTKYGFFADDNELVGSADDPAYRLI